MGHQKNLFFFKFSQTALPNNLPTETIYCYWVKTAESLTQPKHVNHTQISQKQNI